MIQIIERIIAYPARIDHAHIDASGLWRAGWIVRRRGGAGINGRGRLFDVNGLGVTQVHVHMEKPSTSQCEGAVQDVGRWRCVNDARVRSRLVGFFLGLGIVVLKDS